MEQLKQLLQLQKDEVGIREMARRLGISRNSVRKYLSLLTSDSVEDQDNPDSKMLAERAYRNDSMVHDMHRLEQLAIHFKYAQSELGKVGVTRQLHWHEYFATAFGWICLQSLLPSSRLIPEETGCDHGYGVLGC